MSDVSKIRDLQGTSYCVIVGYVGRESLLNSLDHADIGFQNLRQFHI